MCVIYSSFPRRRFVKPGVQFILNSACCYTGGARDRDICIGRLGFNQTRRSKSCIELFTAESIWKSGLLDWFPSAIPKIVCPPRKRKNFFFLLLIHHFLRPVQEKKGTQSPAPVCLMNNMPLHTHRLHATPTLDRGSIVPDQKGAGRHPKFKSSHIHPRGNRDSFPLQDSQATPSRTRRFLPSNLKYE